MIPWLFYYTQFIYVYIMFGKTNICSVPWQASGCWAKNRFAAQNLSCQVFVKISRSLTSSLIIFDRTLLARLSVHISMSLVWQMKPIVDFLFFFLSPLCHQSQGQHCWHWEWLGGKKDSSDRLEQTISAWSKLLSGGEHCVQWLERARGRAL